MEKKDKKIRQIDFYLLQPQFYAKLGMQLCTEKKGSI
jgi:hypothetical protein